MLASLLTPTSCGDNQSGTANKTYQVAIVIFANGIRRFHHFMSLGVNECEQVGHVYATVAPAFGKRYAAAQGAIILLSIGV